MEWLRQRGTYVTADLNTYATIAAQWGRPDVLSSYLDAPQALVLAPEQRKACQNSGYAKRTGPGIDDIRRFLAEFIKALDAAGVLLVMGTDATSIPGLVPGFAVHDNLRALHDAGLTRYQPLSTATRQQAMQSRISRAWLYVTFRTSVEAGSSTVPSLP